MNAKCTGRGIEKTSYVHLVAACTNNALLPTMMSEEEVSHTMHCKPGKGSVSQISTIIFPFTGNLLEGSITAELFSSVYTCTLDLGKIYLTGNVGEYFNFS